MEKSFRSKKGEIIKIIKEPKDPLCMRASIGGKVGEGFYLVFRGDDMDEIEYMLKETLGAFQEFEKK